MLQQASSGRILNVRLKCLNLLYKPRNLLKSFEHRNNNWPELCAINTCVCVSRGSFLLQQGKKSLMLVSAIRFQLHCPQDTPLQSAEWRWILGTVFTQPVTLTTPDLLRWYFLRENHNTCHVEGQIDLLNIASLFSICTHF